MKRIEITHITIKLLNCCYFYFATLSYLLVCFYLSQIGGFPFLSLIHAFLYTHYTLYICTYYLLIFSLMFLRWISRTKQSSKLKELFMNCSELLQLLFIRKNIKKTETLINIINYTSIVTSRVWFHCPLDHFRLIFYNTKLK